MLDRAIATRRDRVLSIDLNPDLITRSMGQSCRPRAIRASLREPVRIF